MYYTVFRKKKKKNSLLSGTLYLQRNDEIVISLISAVFCWKLDQTLDWTVYNHLRRTTAHILLQNYTPISAKNCSSKYCTEEKFCISPESQISTFLLQFSVTGFLGFIRSVVCNFIAKIPKYRARHPMCLTFLPVPVVYTRMYPFEELNWP